MEKTVLTWSAENWITVLLMVFVGGAIIGTVGMFVRRGIGKKNA